MTTIIWIAGYVIIALAAGMLGFITGAGMTVRRVTNGRVFHYDGMDYVCVRAKAEHYAGAKTPTSDASLPRIKAAMESGYFDAQIARAVKRNSERQGNGD